jgi:hypothetical protein
MHNLSKIIKPIRVSNAVAAGAANVVCATVDMQGFTGCMVIARLGAITAGATIGLKAQQGEAADGSDKADLLGSLVSATDADDNKVLILDINRPKGRYITPIVVRAAQNTVIDSVDVILYNASQTPVAADTTVAAAKVLSEPAFGAA